MFKWFFLLVSLIFSVESFATVDIVLACKEKKEQQMSLLPKMSISITEANLAGQCTGYRHYSEVDFNKACSEFVEQKEALLPFMSTSLAEANWAGMCIGGIYRVAKICDVSTSYLNYLGVAKNVYSLRSLKEQLGCYGESYGG